MRRPRNDQTDRLLAATRRRLALLTLGLLAALLVAMAAATVVVALAQLDGATDQALRVATEGTLARLEGSLPEIGAGGENSGSEEPVGPADSFALVLDPSGRVVENARHIALAGLPDRTALAAALAHGSDLRTVSAAGTRIRLLTLPIVSGDGGATVGAVQAGLVLSLHDRQAADLVRTIVLVGLAGLACAALLALLLTGRALVPIRSAFATERRFVAAASHELRTPAALIRASAEVLQRERLVRDEGVPLLSGIVAEADRLARLVGDLLALAASRADPDAVQLERTDLGAIARDAIERAEPLARGRGCALAGDAAASLPVMADPGRMLQVLLALLDNATTHAPGGSTVTVTAWRDGPRACVSVADEGPGVPASQRDRVFEPFVRVATEGRVRGEGSGLGLSVARSIVQRHGGTIGIDDAPGGGARVTVRLPLAG